MNARITPMSLLAAAVFLSSRAGATEPVVSNMHASQAAGTKLVELSYDISGGTPPYSVSVQGSADGGATWTLPVATVSGNVGAGVAPGLARKITWNAGQDWNGQYSAAVRFRITALDTTAAPEGFALIPAGNFQMGQDGIATPVHTVYVSEFFMAKYETTKESWDEVRAWGVHDGYTDLPVGNAKGKNHPVHSINWYDAVKWCNARSENENLVPCYTVSGATYKTGQSSTVVCNFGASGYRLPTEAEWEKAARGGQTVYNFHWGNDITHDQANYNSSSSYPYDKSLTQGYHPSYQAGGTPYTAPVNSFTPNNYGLFNMSGNVWEWCWDWYGPYTADLQTNPLGAPSGSIRLRRGGSWYNPAPNSRVASRNTGASPSIRDYDRGFRLARSSVPWSSR